MKQVEFNIENLRRPRLALNAALTQAMVMIAQKGVTQATVTLAIDMEMDQTDDGWQPNISYKTSVRVPLDIKQAGREENCRQVYWDQQAMSYMMQIDGEQVAIDELDKRAEDD